MKLTIYLPDDLAAAMKAELNGVNISAVCQQAIRAEIARARNALWFWDVEEVTSDRSR